MNSLNRVDTLERVESELFHEGSLSWFGHLIITWPPPTRSRDYIFHLVQECFWVCQEELESVAGKNINKNSKDICHSAMVLDRRRKGIDGMPGIFVGEKNKKNKNVSTGTKYL